MSAVRWKRDRESPEEWTRTSFNKADDDDAKQFPSRRYIPRDDFTISQVDPLHRQRPRTVEVMAGVWVRCAWEFIVAV